MRLRVVPLLGLLILVTGGTACRGAETNKAALMKSGDAFAAEGKWPEAIVQFRNALKIDPKMGVAHAHLADALLKSNPDDFRAALRERVLAAEMLPTDNDAQLKAGQLLVLAGRWEDASARADQVLQNDPKSSSAYILKGSIAAGQSNLAGATLYVNEAIERAPRDARGHVSLGMLQLGRKERDEAEASFKRAVEVDPTSPVGHLALANLYWATGRAAETEPELKQVVKLDPGNLSAQETLASFYASTGRTAEAEAPLKAVAEARKDMPSRLALADYYVRSQRVDEAEKILKSAAADKKGGLEADVRLAGLAYSRNLKADAYRQIEAVLARQPAHAAALTMKARFLLDDGKIDEARDRAQAAVKSDPKSADAQFLLGSILVRKNDVDGAIRAFSDVLAINPMAQGAQLQLVELRLQQGSPEALLLAESAVKINPKDALPTIMLARAIMLRGDLSRAQGLFQGLLAEHDAVSVLHAQLGVLRMLQKNPGEARKEFERALALDPASFEAFRGRVEVELADRKVAVARDLVEAQLKKTPDVPDLLLLTAKIDDLAGDFVQEEARLRKALQIDPTNEKAFTSLAQVFGRQGKLDQARAEYETLARQQPTSVVAPTMVALILEVQHKPKEAQKIYEAVLAATPTAAVAANNLAMLYTEDGGKLDAALKHAQTAKQQMPNSPNVDDTLGWVYYRMKQAGLAIPPFEASVKGDPKNPEFRYHLGLAYAQAGDTGKALSAFGEALKLNPNYREAADARLALQQRR